MTQTKRWSRVIVYGGSFDPPHRGHVTLPFDAARQISADGVMFVPAGQPPHKQTRTLTAAHHRLAMLRLALGERDDATICTWEIDRGGNPANPNYTVDTLEHLRNELGEDVKMRLLIGADMAMIFDQWRSPGRIIELSEPLVMLRPPGDIEALLAHFPPADRASWRNRVVITPQVDVSSTQLREQLSAHQPIEPSDALDPAVLAYIRTHQLYEK